MKIVIFGGAGFIGSNIARFYSNEGNQIIIIDNLSRKCSDLNLKDLLTYQNIKFYNYDIVKNFKEICEIVNTDIDVVYHCAAQVAVTTSIFDPRLDLETNILGSFNVLESCRLAKKKPIIFFSSTNKVYGNLDNIPLIIKNSKYTSTEYPEGINEDFSLNFYSPYGCSKGAADQYFLDYSRIYGLKTVVFRKSCIYGNNQFGVEDQGWLSWFAIAMLFQKKITIYGNGSQVRDLLFIDDLMTAYDLALKNIDRTAGKVYNIGGGINFSVSVNEVVERLKMFFNYNVELIFQNERQGDQKYYVSNYNKAKKDFNWEPIVSPEIGIKKMLDWIYNNKELIKKIF
jgi:CDP-paratose 2-epimerase